MYAKEDIDYQEQERSLVRLTFNTDSGKKLLDFWKKKYFEMPCCPPNTINGYGFYREGENEFLRTIIRSITEYERYENE